MKYSIIIKESASIDIVEAFLYYESKQSGLGERFLKRWEEQLELLISER